MGNMRKVDLSAPDNKTLLEHLQKQADNGARKICGAHTCTAFYPCGHSNKKDLGIRPISNSATCPLAHYGVTPIQDNRPWHQVPVSEVEPTENEMFALCALCDNGTLCEDEEDHNTLIVQRKALEICLDCPVKMLEEAREEAEAEC